MIIYLRIDKKRKEIEFHSTWEDARTKKGKIRKFRKEQKWEMLQEIMGIWRNLTPYELDKWTAPDWIKDRAYRRMKTEIYLTQVNGIIYYIFKGDVTPTIINKGEVFMSLYDMNEYIYSLLKSISYFHEAETLFCYTDIADLLRLNRIYYNSSYSNKVIIELTDYYEIRNKIGGLANGN